MASRRSRSGMELALGPWDGSRTCHRLPTMSPVASFRVLFLNTFGRGKKSEGEAGQQVGGAEG